MRVTGVEPARRKAQDPKSCVSANSTIPAFDLLYIKIIPFVKKLRFIHFFLTIAIVILRVIDMKKHFYKILNAKQFLFIVCALSVSILLVFGVDIVYTKATLQSEQNAVPVIIIDAGHGGEDGGTQSSTGILEKDINLSISLKLEALFNSLGFKTIMVRTSDEMIYDGSCKTIREKKASDIHNRMNLMLSYPNSIFLSIHQNHFSESKYRGAQVFYSKNNPESEIIAESIQKSIVEKLQNENERMIKPSGTEIYLLYHAKTPAVMVECGFLSNGGEAQLLNDESYQKKMAVAVADGVIKYLNNRK